MVLALFDDLTTLDEKQDMAVMLLNTHRPHAFATGKPDQPEFCPVATKLTNEKPSIAVFITEHSWLLFHHLGSDAAWLQSILHCGLTMKTLSPAKDSAMT